MRLVFFYLLVMGYTIWLRVLVGRDGIGWQDDSTGFSPLSYPDYWEHLKYYYNVAAGRIGQETNLFFFSRFYRFFEISPLNVPWFSIRIIEAAMQLLAFGNFFRGGLRISNVSSPKAELTFYWLGFVFFALNSTLSEAMSMVLNISNYTTPIFVYSLIFLNYTKKPEQEPKGFKLVWLSLLLFYIGLCHEQLLFLSGTLTLALLATPFFTGKINIQQFIRRMIWALAIYVPATLIHFLSPGNLSRLALYNPERIVYVTQWRTETARTWLKLFHLPDWHSGRLSWLLMIGFVVSIVFCVYLLSKRKWKFKTPDQTMAFLGLVFVFGSVLMHVSLLSSGYFPERARTMPMVSYLTGTFFLLLCGIRFLFSKINRVTLRKVFSLVLMLFVIIVSVKTPKYFAEAWRWWNVWDDIGGRAHKLYSLLNKEVKKTNHIILYDMSSCGDIPATYDTAATTVNMLKWIGIEDRVEVKFQGKVENPKSSKLPRSPKPFPCSSDYLAKTSV